MKIKNLQKSLKKVVKKDLGADGYVRLDTINIDLDADGKYITIKGAYGRMVDGKVIFQEDFELFYADGMSADNVAGMLYQKMSDQADGN